MLKVDSKSYALSKNDYYGYRVRGIITSKKVLIVYNIPTLHNLYVHFNMV